MSDFSERPADQSFSSSADLIGLVTYVANTLIVEETAEVEVVETKNGTAIRLHVSEANMGRVIGKDGRIANALRTLLRAGSVGSKKRVMLDIE